MQHKRNHTLDRLKKKYKHLAAAIAGVVILSGAALPGVHSPAAQASPAPQKEAAQPVQHAKKVVLKTKKQKHSAPAQFKKALDIKATAYAPGAHDNDQWGDKTFLGTNIRPGVIAVDPNVIPLGSHVYIEYPDGHGEYATAEDTGGAIKGNRIDVAKWSVNEAEDFGIKNVKVYILSSPHKV